MRLSIAGSFKKIILPLVVVLVIACGMVARHNAEQSQALYEEALYLYESGEYEASLEVVMRSLDKAEGPLGISGGSVATIFNLLGLALSDLGRYDEADAAYARAIELEEYWIGVEGNLDYATMLRNVAQLRIGQERYAEAVELAQQSLEICRQAGSEDVALANLILAYAAGEAADYPLSYESARAAVDGLKADSLLDKYNLVIALQWQAYSGAKLEQGQEAEALLLRALGIAEAELPALVGDLFSTLSDIYDEQGQPEKIESIYLEYLEKAEQLRSEAAGEGQTPDSAMRLDMRLSQALVRLGHFYFEDGQYERSAQYYLRASELDASLYGDDHFYVVVGLNDLGLAYELGGNYAGAEQAYLRALALLEAAVEPDRDNLYFVLQNLGNVYEKSGQVNKQTEVSQRLRLLVLDQAEESAVQAPAAAPVPASM